MIHTQMHDIDAERCHTTDDGPASTLRDARCTVGERTEEAKREEHSALTLGSMCYLPSTQRLPCVDAAPCATTRLSLLCLRNLASAQECHRCTPNAHERTAVSNAHTWGECNTEMQTRWQRQLNAAGILGRQRSTPSRSRSRPSCADQCTAIGNAARTVRRGVRDRCLSAWSPVRDSYDGARRSAIGWATRSRISLTHSRFSAVCSHRDNASAALATRNIMLALSVSSFAAPV